MCRLCALAPVDLEIPPVRAKYGPERFLNKLIPVSKGEFVLDAIKKSVKDPFEQMAVYDLFMASLSSFSGIAVPTSAAPVTAVCVKEGVSEEIIEFEKALGLLQQHNPTRMKTLEQLEGNFHKAVQTVKQQRSSALSSLHRRQALEMDMLSSETMDKKMMKSELESLVSQHVSEMDSVQAHWKREVKKAQDRQLKEYRDLVLEVFESEKKTCSLTVSKRRSYCRPFVGESSAEFVRMLPLAVRPDPVRPVRVIRATEFRGDFLSLVFAPILEPEDAPGLDPEEQCMESKTNIKSAAVVGSYPNCFDSNSNQRDQLVQVIDTDCYTDCRYPSLADQLARVGSLCAGQIAVTRHSNLGNGVSVIFHVVEADAEVFEKILSLCDCLKIHRLFVPHVIVPDLRVPSLTSQPHVQHILVTAARKMSNFILNPSLDQLVFINP